MSTLEIGTNAPALQHGGRPDSGEGAAAEVGAGAGGTTNVRRLQVAKHEPTASVVSMLESMLEQARAGEYNAVMIVATDWEGCVTDCFALAQGTAKYPLIGGAYCMLQKFIDKAIE